MKTLLHAGEFILCLLIANMAAFPQISPGPLSNAHSHLEGISNCTKCHVLGKAETISKCLECHVEIDDLIKRRKGYHGYSPAGRKPCRECHGEHFGRNFQVIKLDTADFNHHLTGYRLEGKHKTADCSDCHRQQLIRYPVSQKKQGTFLGLGSDCISCHEDVHQNTLSAVCTSCHDQNAFRPAPNFDHSGTRFPLAGRHRQAACTGCHRQETRNGKPFQKFAGVQYTNCTNCHEDIHQGRFGANCRTCHSEFSFKEAGASGTFNHDQTNYPLRGRHSQVDCRECHKGAYTRSIRHTFCSDCHTDYHEGQFVRAGRSPDCSDCHQVTGFSPSTYDIVRHNASGYALKGAHLATPCTACHKPYGKWNFAIRGDRCTNCHSDIHSTFIDQTYYPGQNCLTCHSGESWNTISFDHNRTKFSLEGRHETTGCRQCHFKQTGSKILQQFSGIGESCENCHEDVHARQFLDNGHNDCQRCHTFNNWSPDKFDHNQARFRLDGKHEGLECMKCHKLADGLIRKYIIYKFNDISCASCHS